MVLSDGRIILVDRGWVPGDVLRQIFPAPPTPETEVSFVGTAYLPPTKKILLGKEMEIKSTNSAIIEVLDTTRIGQFLHKSVQPFIMRLNQNQPYGFVREWPLVSMPPERHYGYALQWFAMAFLVLLVFVALNLNRSHKSDFV
jgi:surfeit locus 1 family protein